MAGNNISLFSFMWGFFIIIKWIHISFVSCDVNIELFILKHHLLMLSRKRIIYPQKENWRPTISRCLHLIVIFFKFLSLLKSSESLLEVIVEKVVLIDYLISFCFVQLHENFGSCKTTIFYSVLSLQSIHIQGRSAHFHPVCGNDMVCHKV